MLRYPPLVRAVFSHRVAAAAEHFSAIRFCAANTLVDAGANKGQFSLAFRTLRPEAEIIAFEPLPSEADVYEQVLPPDGRTRLQRVALASAEDKATFYVADRADSSSLLRPGKGQERAFGVRGESTIEVSVKRLDDCVDFAALAHPILLKVDVQGGELGVFQGCDTLGEVDFIYVELSFTELYEGQPLFEEVTDYLKTRGFTVAGIFNQVMTAEFGPTQVDALFKRV
ncbi:FkbM family methyltransferase [Mycolicibacterium vinylchloridicum]|uniref:FkbM family methyltransferase n=1 Tax=Mycolicibacterium vinylchloridicum TaxID=2736928 RepID=UPI001F012D88|nr:FkbM family methyltransferase [Mycolicibacterium vinylchloridicum]